ncbi:hypothetical protein EJB05_26966, partial [Eragrostis curvula]
MKHGRNGHFTSPSARNTAVSSTLRIEAVREREAMRGGGASARRREAVARRPDQPTTATSSTLHDLPLTCFSPVIASLSSSSPRANFLILRSGTAGAPSPPRVASHGGIVVHAGFRWYTGLRFLTWDLGKRGLIGGLVQHGGRVHVHLGSAGDELQLHNAERADLQPHDVASETGFAGRRVVDGAPKH